MQMCGVKVHVDTKSEQLPHEREEVWAVVIVGIKKIKLVFLS